MNGTEYSDKDAESQIEHLIGLDHERFAREDSSGNRNMMPSLRNSFRKRKNSTEYETNQLSKSQS